MKAYRTVQVVAWGVLILLIAIPLYVLESPSAMIIVLGVLNLLISVYAVLLSGTNALTQR